MRKSSILKLPTIKKLNSLVSMGHIPSRGMEAYSTAQLGACNNYVYKLVNCYNHACFNLSNEELAQINFDTNDKNNMMGHVSLFASDEKIERSLMGLVEDTGLKVQESQPGAIIKNNQWIVSMYYSNTWIRDYHFLLRENDGTWSSKEGFEDELNFIDNPEKTYRGYEYYKTFCITNPYAPEDEIKK